MRNSPQDTNQTFEICFHSEIYLVKQIINQILQFLTDHIPSLSEEDTFDLKLIYSELLLNAVIHGNKRDLTKSVYLFAEITGDTVYSMVSDEGSGFDYINLLSSMKSNENLSGETGRGIRLVYSLTDSLSFNMTGNQITFYKRVNPNGKSSDR